MNRKQKSYNLFTTKSEINASLDNHNRRDRLQREWTDEQMSINIGRTVIVYYQTDDNDS